MKSVLYFELLKLKIQHIFTKFYEYRIYVIFFVQLKKKISENLLNHPPKKRWESRC